MATLSKVDYLKRYKSKKGDPTKNRPRKSKNNELKSNVRIVDDDVDFKSLLPANLGNTLDEDIGDNPPVIAGIIDERPEHVKQLELYKTDGRWKTIKSRDSERIQKHDSDQSSSRRRRHDSDSDQSPRRKNNRDTDSDQSPRRKNDHDTDSDQSPRRKNDADSDQSTSRLKSYAELGRLPHITKRFNTDDVQPVIGRNRHDSDSDQSPIRIKPHNSHSNQSPMIKKRRDSDQSPIRKKRHNSDSDQSPIRKDRQDSDSDQSPIRKDRHDSDSDQSPIRKKRHNSDSDQSPIRSKKLCSTASSQRIQNRDSHKSPSRNKHPDDDSDQSPIRKRSGFSDHVERSRFKTNSDDQSPTRRPEKVVISSITKRSHDSHEHGDVRRDRGDVKPKETLKGAVAGLSSAEQMRREAEMLRKRRDETFRQVSSDISGRYSATVRRDRSGRRRNLSQEREEKEKEASEKAKLDEKYAMWGKGLKQAAEASERASDAVHEAAKPLARYRDDADLDRQMRESIREGDPLAAFARPKSKNSDSTTGKPAYRGSAPPNRYGIQPGYRWDGVDRSNGFENKLFTKQSDRKAISHDAYKWSIEDM